MPAAFCSSYNHSKRSRSEEKEADRHFVYIELMYTDDNIKNIQHIFVSYTVDIVHYNS